MSLVTWDQKDFSDGLSQWIDAGNGDHPDDAALSDFGASLQEALLALFKCANEWGSYEGEVTCAQRSHTALCLVHRNFGNRNST